MDLYNAFIFFLVIVSIIFFVLHIYLMVYGGPDYPLPKGDNAGQGKRFDSDVE